MPMAIADSAPIANSPLTMMSAPIARVAVIFSPSQIVAISSPPSVAQDG